MSSLDGDVTLHGHVESQDMSVIRSAFGIQASVVSQVPLRRWCL